MTENDAEKAEIDCQKGCSHCCGMIVKPTMPELFIILNHIVETYSAEEVEKLMQDLRQHQKLCKENQAVEKRVKVYCSFLDNDVCSIEKVKPLSCRAYTSIDVECCKAFVEDPSLEIPMSICHYSPFDITRKAIMKSLYLAGFTVVVEELNSGMLRLLEEEFDL